MIERITKPPVLTEKQCKKIWKLIETDYRRSLAPEGVKSVKYGTAGAYQLICLKYMEGKFIHKDAISNFVQSHLPNAGNDQQVRHLNTQKGWYVTNKGQKIYNENTPSGFHMLVTTKEPAPNFIARREKRNNVLNASNFNELKKAYNNSCACCHIKEGEVDMRTGRVVKLQQGHMDPSKPLSLDNTIPQCEYCNQSSKDNFIFDRDGNIAKIINAEWILKHSTPEVRKELSAYFNTQSNKNAVPC